MLPVTLIGLHIQQGDAQVEGTYVNCCNPIHACVSVITIHLKVTYYIAWNLPDPLSSAS